MFLMGVFVSKWWLVLLLAYPAQIIRIAVRARRLVPNPWAYAAIMTVSHIAGFQGVCQYALQATTGSAPRQADYK